jgi:hypothetical protein
MDAAALGSTFVALLTLQFKISPTAMFVSAIADLNMLCFVSFIVILYCFCYFQSCDCFMYPDCSLVKSSGVVRKSNFGRDIRQSGQQRHCTNASCRYFSSSIYVMITSIGLILV